MIDLYVHQQRSLKATARELGVDPRRVRTILRRNGIALPGPAQRAPLPDIDAETFRQLYVTERRSLREIAERYDQSLAQVRRLPAALRVRRPRALPPGRRPPPTPPATELQQRYDELGSLAAVATHYRSTGRTVRAWFTAAGIPVREATSPARRTTLDPKVLRDLYEVRGWSARDIAAVLDTTIPQVLRGLRDYRIPIRPGGTPPGGPSGQDLLTALYDDPDVAELCRRHRLPRRRAGGTLTTRFPQPRPLAPALLRTAYLEIGLSAQHLELLTGNPAARIRRALRSNDIPLRRHGLSPWLARHLGRRSGSAYGAL